MNYEIFISYEISDSSLAYELVAALGRNNVTYYLDCANSSVTMGGYVKGIFESCRVFVPLVSVRYLSQGYARELLSCAVGTNKQVQPCFTDDCVLPDEFAACISDGNRLDVRGGDGEAVWNAISRLLARGEEKITEDVREVSYEGSHEEVQEESYEEPSVSIIENVPELEPDIEVPVGQATTIDVEEAGRIRYYKPEPPKTVIQDRVEKKDEKEETWIRWFLFAFFAVIFIVMKCSDDEPRVSYPERQKFTTEQIAEGQRINKLASDYYYGRNGIEKNRGKAVELYLQASELGNADATYNVGMCAKLGMGCRKDLDVASHYFYLATKMGNERAFGELKELAEAGDANAQNRYGLCFGYGYGTKVIPKNAVYWYDQAAKQGYSYAQYNLAQCYFYGRGVKRNERVAATWFRKAAEGGHAEAQYELGLCYLDGSGVSKNLSESFGWLSKAAEQDHVDALNQLAYSYADGLGTTPDMSMAHATIDKAIRIDPDEANLYDSKGEFYMRVGDRTNALEMYKKVIEKDSRFYVNQSPTPLYNYINNR